MNFSWEDVKDYSEGDILKLDGKRYRLLKKTTTAIAARRYYWFDAAIDWLARNACRE